MRVTVNLYSDAENEDATVALMKRENARFTLLKQKQNLLDTLEAALLLDIDSIQAKLLRKRVREVTLEMRVIKAFWDYIGLEDVYVQRGRERVSVPANCLDGL